MSSSLVGLVRSQIRQSGGDQVYLSYFYPQRIQPLAVSLQAISYKLDQLHYKPTPIANLQFQWWNQEIANAFNGQPVDEPSIVLIKQATTQFRLSQYHLSRLIKAHQNLVNNQHRLSNLQDLADWSAATQASILYLLLQATSEHTKPSAPVPHSVPFQHTGDEHSGPVPSDPRQLTALDFDHAASHLAVGLAIQQLLVQIPINAKHRINLIPTEIGARFGLTDEALFRLGPNAPGLRESVANLVGIGRKELATSRECLNPTIPKQRIPVFLGSVLAHSVFDKLETDSLAFNVFDPALHKRDWKLPLKLLIRNYRSNF